MSNCVPIVTAANGPIIGLKNWSIAGGATRRIRERPGKVVVIWLKQLELSQGWSVMQIMPSGAAWTNPAALSQQASADTKHVAARNSEATSTEPVNPLEESGKTTDRDANERYDGPQHSDGKIGSVAKEFESGTESMMSLPANDDLDAPTLDLLS